MNPSTHERLFLTNNAIWAAGRDLDAGYVAAAELAARISERAVVRDAIALARLVETHLGVGKRVLDAEVTVGVVSLRPAADAQLHAIRLASAEYVARRIRVVATRLAPLEFTDTASWAPA